MTRNKLLILIGIVLLALFLRVWQLPSVPAGLYPDEAMNGNNALEALKTGEWKVFYPENNGREGLFINIQAAGIAAFGVHEPWVLRFPSAIIGTLTVLGAVLLFYRLAIASHLSHPFIIAASGSLFFALSHWHLIFSRIGFRAIAAPFFLVWAVYFFLLSLESQRFRYIILSGISFGLGMYTYIAYRGMPAVLLSFIPFYRRQRGFWHSFLGTAIVAAMVAVPVGAYFVMHPYDFFGRTNQLSVFASSTPYRDLAANIGKTALMFFTSGDSNWRHNFAGQPQLFPPVALLFLIGIGAALKRRSLYDVTFLWWILLASVPAVISNEGMPHALRAIIMIPAVFGLVGIGAAVAWQYGTDRLPQSSRNVITTLVILSAFSYSFFGYFYYWNNHPEVGKAFAAEYVAIGREINALPLYTEKYVVVAAPGGDVRGIPMPAQTVMFITDSFRREDQAARHIQYVLPSQYEGLKSLSPDTAVFILK